MPQCQFPVFCYFCVSEKLHRKYFRNWTKQVLELLFFPCSAAAVEDKFRGTEVSVPAPCRDGEVPPEPSPSVSITVSTVSIDLTAISIAVVASDNEEGVVLPRG
jgi:hypothetical protein